MKNVWNVLQAGQHDRDVKRNIFFLLWINFNIYPLAKDNDDYAISNQ